MEGQMIVERRDIPGFAGYRVSEGGCVESCRNNHGQITDSWHSLKPILQPTTKRLTVNRACQNGNYRFKTMQVHQLVMLAFVGPQPAGSQVRHLDGNPLNNALSNLCYGTPKENGEDAARHGSLAGENNAAAKITWAIAAKIRLLTRLPRDCRSDLSKS
jgi:hypothetical protein